MSVSVPEGTIDGEFSAELLTVNGVPIRLAKEIDLLEVVDIKLE